MKQLMWLRIVPLETDLCVWCNALIVVQTIKKLRRRRSVDLVRPSSQVSHKIPLMMIQDHMD